MSNPNLKRKYFDKNQERCGSLSRNARNPFQCVPLQSTRSMDKKKALLANKGKACSANLVSLNLGLMWHHFGYLESAKLVLIKLLMKPYLSCFYGCLKK